MKKKEYIKPASSIYALAVEAQTAGFGHPTGPTEGDVNGEIEDDGELHDAAWWEDYWEKHGYPNN